MMGLRQIVLAHGYDHNWVSNRSDGLTLAARVYEPTSGRVMEVSTTQPGVQFYTVNFSMARTGKKGHVIQAPYGLCWREQNSRIRRILRISRARF